MIGTIYLRLRQGYNPWRKMARLMLRSSALLRRARTAERREGYVVTLTSIPQRSRQLRYTLLSILAGEELPERVVLYVSEKTRTSIEAAKDSVLNELQASDFLTVRTVIDVGPHTKLIYGLQELPDKHLIVCDDDVIYPPYWFAALRQRHAEVADQRMLVCYRGHRINRDGDGQLLPYKAWTKELASDPARLVHRDYFPTGTGGVLFPAGAMPALTWSAADFTTYAPKADDIWFYLCALLNDYTVSLTHRSFSKEDTPEIPNYNTPNLYDENVNNGGNDQQFTASLNYLRQRHGLTWPEG